MKHVPSNIVHPWHGITLTKDNYNSVQCYVEVTPSDTVKFELDKETGLLKIDRPQKYSNLCPCLYGLLPKTFSGDKVAAHCSETIHKENIQGDADPLDICILTEKHIPHGNILVTANPIGGFRLIDSNEADDKIIAVLEEDLVYGKYQDISDCPKELLEQIQHYFLTYKASPENLSLCIPGKIRCEGIYGKEEAKKIIDLAHQDYKNIFSIK